MEKFHLAVTGDFLQIDDNFYPLTEVRDTKFDRGGKVVVKIGNKVFTATLSKDISLIGADVCHLCANCARLSSAADPNGCIKVRTASEKIERYPFINSGFETTQSMLVTQCSQYKKEVVTKKTAVLTAAQLEFLFDFYMAHLERYHHTQ